MNILKALGLVKSKSGNEVLAEAVESYIGGVAALAKAVESVAAVLIEHHAAIEEMRDNQRIIIEALEATRGPLYHRNESKAN